MDAATTKIVVNDKYVIIVEETEHFVFEVGFTEGHPSATFTHPNIARTASRVLEFKHYRGDGSKYWTRENGGSHFFVVPRSAVEVLPEETNSYPKVTVNGVMIQLNTSGGTNKNGWADWITAHPSTLVNLPITSLKALAKAAVRGTKHEPIKLHEEIEEEFYAAHKNDLLVNAAWGDWHERVPKGMVGVVATVGGHRSADHKKERWFLIPEKEYDARSIQFVVDPSKHKETEDFTKEAAA
jgi:hypothetical protein